MPARGSPLGSALKSARRVGARARVIYDGGGAGPHFMEANNGQEHSMASRCHCEAAETRYPGPALPWQCSKAIPFAEEN
eukprot:749597-Hanusia_phi.AAC.11